LTRKKPTSETLIAHGIMTTIVVKKKTRTRKRPKSGSQNGNRVCGVVEPRRLRTFRRSMDAAMNIVQTVLHGGHCTINQFQSLRRSTIVLGQHHFKKVRDEYYSIA